MNTKNEEIIQKLQLKNTEIEDDFKNKIELIKAKFIWEMKESGGIIILNFNNVEESQKLK